MPRPQFTLTTLLWLTVVVAAFCAGTRSQRFLEERRPNPFEWRIWVALDEQTSLDVKEQPLRDVLEYLGHRHEIYFVLDQETLKKAGVATDSPVTCSFSGITLRSALKLLLNDREVTTTQVVYPWLRFKALLWVAAMVATFVGASKFARKRGRRATAAAPTTRPDRWNNPTPRRFFLKAMLWLMAVMGAFWIGTWWPAIAPEWGEPSYQESAYGWGKLRWWTGREEMVKWIPDAANVDTRRTFDARHSLLAPLVVRRRFGRGRARRMGLLACLSIGRTTGRDLQRRELA